MLTFNTTVSVMSVCLSVCPHVTIQVLLNGFP